MNIFLVMRCPHICAAILICMLGSLAPGMLAAQSIGDEVYETIPYEKRITLTYIDEVYIPADLNDAIAVLDKKMEQAARDRFAALTEADAATKPYFSFGKWMNINWSLEEGSRLSHYFRSRGVGKTEDMIRILMTAYHRHLRNVPVAEQELIDKYKALRRSEYEAYQERLRKLPAIDTVPRRGQR